MQIGIFDYGIGELTVLKEMIREYPKHHYFGDAANLPYSTKSKEELSILDCKYVLEEVKYA